MKVREIAELIEKTAPKELAYEWDNVGLLIGDKNKDINRVFVTLDANLTTAREAVDAGADMIISHHPIFFNPLKRIEYGTPEGDMIRLLIENNIPLYAAHTNMDAAEGGINDKLAEIFRLSDVRVLEPNRNNPAAGLGRYGKGTREVEFASFVEIACMLLRTPVRYAGDERRIIRKVAVAGGACADLAPMAKAAGCDVLVTADVKYHEMIDAYESGICVIDAGHYPTEICVMDIFSEILKDTGLEIIRSESKDIFKFIKQ